MRRFALFFLVSWAIWAQRPAVSRDTMAVVEKAFDERIMKFSPDDPFDLLGTTRGVYLEGFGVVLTAEVNLVVSPGISPFHPTFTKEEIAKVRQKKLQRVQVLKQMMAEQLEKTASVLNMLPPNEQIVLGVTLLYRPWEDTTGLPRQIVMQAPRKVFYSTPRAQLLGAMQVQEY